MSPLYIKLQELGGLWSKISESKLKNILLLCCCILKTRTTNLAKNKESVGEVLGDKMIKSGTAYSKLSRIFQTGLSKELLRAVQLMILYIIKADSRSLLILDRTEFGVGKRWINYLVIGIEWHQVFIPLVWKDLGGRGISSQKQRRELLKDLLVLWRASKLEIPHLQITGDREFTGHEWLSDLAAMNIDYVIRIKSCLRFKVLINRRFKEKAIKLEVVARYMQRTGKQKMKIRIGKKHVAYIMLLPQENQNAKESFVLLVTSLKSWSEARKIFRRRWPIECCFKHLKSNGFDLEKIKVEGQHKTELFFAILTLVYVLAIKEGVVNKYEEVVKFKLSSNGKKYRKQSLFRFGIYHLKLIVKELHNMIQLIDRLFDELIVKFTCEKLLFEKSIVQS